MFDIDKIRQDFPMLQGKTNEGKPLIYLDNGATTLKPQCVIEAVSNYYQNITSNINRGDYQLANIVDKAYEEVRQTVSEFINCQSREIVFTSGTTHALNQIAFGYGLKYLKEDDEILISLAEHASNTLPWYRVAEKTGCKVRFIPLDETGKITVDNVKKMLSEKVKIVSIAHATNVLGHISDVKEISKVVHQVGGIVVVDGAQSVPHIKTDVQDLDCDFLAFSGHKICGPTASGVLYGKYHLLEKMEPLMSGGGMNARFDIDFNVLLKKAPYKFEAGTPNIEAALGLKAAIQYVEKIGLDNIVKYVKQLRDYAIEEMKKLDNIIIYNQKADTGIISFNVVDNGQILFGQDVSAYLSKHGLCLRSGNHCAKNLWQHLKTDSTVRCALYFYNTKNEVDKLIEVLKNTTLKNCIDVIL
ncbi:MAG: aminotransferase class V-fold PLP-dependent enzyme [Erysipelotrichaceae bacterium]|jgi:cysteine desulfurase/selenocysteine lyase